MNSLRTMIINADDFGMSREVNEGIKQGIEAGVITSVSVMVNMPYYKDAIAFLKKHPEVSVGLHFNISEGHPILSPHQLATLLREDDYFYNWITLTLNLILRQICLKEVEKELTAQFTILKKSGLPINHIDGHHHLHLYPSIFQIVAKFAKKENLNAVRSCQRSFPLMTQIFQHGFSIRKAIISNLFYFDSFFLGTNRNLCKINYIYDINWNNEITEKSFLQLITSLPKGNTEIICHPGVVSKTGNRKFLEPRLKCLKLLLSPRFKKALKDNDIQLVDKII